MGFSAELLPAGRVSRTGVFLLRATCVAALVSLTACGGGDDGGDDTSAKSTTVTVSGLTVDGLVLSNGTDSVTLAANASSATLPAGGTLTVARQPKGFTKACDVGGTATAPTVSCGDAVGRVTSVAGHGTINNNVPSIPTAIVAGANDILYLANSTAVYQASPTGGYELIAGSLSAGGYTDAPIAANALFSNISYMTRDAQGNVFLIDQNGAQLRQITPAGVVSTVYSAPSGTPLTKVVAVGNGVVYVADNANDIHKLTLATNADDIVANGNGFVLSMAVAPDGTVFYGTNNGVYKLVNQQPVMVAAGASAILPPNATPPSITIANYSGALALAVDARGVIYFADQSGQVVKRIDTAGVVTTIAGDPNSPGVADGTGSAAAFPFLRQLALSADGTVLYGIESSTNVRVIRDLSASAAQVTTTLRPYFDSSKLTDATPAGFAAISEPVGVAVTADGITYLSDNNSRTIRKIAADGTMTVLAGNGFSAYTNGSGTSASFNDPQGLALDTAGNLYVADGCQIRKVTVSGVVSTFAGTSSCGTAEGAVGSTPVAGVTAVAVDAAGVVYFVNGNANSVFKVAGGQVTAVAGYPSSVQLTVDGQNSVPVFSATSMAVDASGNIYVPSRYGHVIVKIAQSGATPVVSRLAGQLNNAGTVDGDALTTAKFSYPLGVTTDTLGNVYVVQEGQGQSEAAVRKVSPAGVVSTLAGGSSTVGYSNGVGADAVFRAPSGIAVNAAGELIVADRNNGRLRKVSPVKAP